MNVGSLTECLC